MKKIFVLLLILIFACNIFPQHYGAAGVGVEEQPTKVVKKETDVGILIEGKLYSQEYLNRHYIALEEKRYSFGLDYLVKHKTKMKVYAVRKDTGATKYKLLKKWEVAKGRYIKSMIRIGYFIDLKTGEYKTFDDITNGF